MKYTPRATFRRCVCLICWDQPPPRTNAVQNSLIQKFNKSQKLMRFYGRAVSYDSFIKRKITTIVNGNWTGFEIQRTHFIIPGKDVSLIRRTTATKKRALNTIKMKNTKKKHQNFREFMLIESGLFVSLFVLFSVELSSFFSLEFQTQLFVWSFSCY